MKKITFGLLVALISSVLHADKGCGYFNISITNNTNHACELLGYRAVAGSLVSDIPQVIPAGAATPFVVTQQSYLFRPTLLLEYRCGPRKVSLTSHQNFCFLEAGEVSGEVYTSSDMHAKYINENGSFFLGLPGTIYWSIV